MAKGAGMSSGGASFSYVGTMSDGGLLTGPSYGGGSRGCGGSTTVFLGEGLFAVLSVTIEVFLSHWSS